MKKNIDGMYQKRCNITDTYNPEFFEAAYKNVSICNKSEQSTKNSS